VLKIAFVIDGGHFGRESVEKIFDNSRNRCHEVLARAVSEPYVSQASQQEPGFHSSRYWEMRGTS
jgi:hypothetical protein